MEGRRVYVLGPDGNLQTSFGRRGDGPGEYRRIDGVAKLAPDSIVVSDVTSGRISVHASDGTFGRSFSFAPQRSLVFTLEESRFSFAVDATHEGRFLYIVTAYSPASRSRLQGWQWLDAPLLSSDRRGEVVDTLRMIPYRERYWEAGQNVPAPFPHFGSMQAHHAGWAWASNTEGEVRWYDPDGRLVQIFRWEPRLVEVTDEVWSDYSEAWLSQVASNPEASGSAFAQRMRELIERQKTLHDGTLPVFGWFVVGQDGSVWLSEYTMPFVPPTVYLVVSKDGSRYHRVTVPEKFTLLDARGDRVLGVWKDDLDIEAVTVLEVSGLSR